MFNVDWSLLIKRLMPQRKRTADHLDWIKALIAPLKELYFIFLEYRKTILYRLSINCEIIYLEKLLNDQFNNGLPAYTGETIFSPGTPTGIYISDPGVYLLPNYIWKKIEQRPKTFIYNKWKSDINYLKDEFAVYGSLVYKARLANHNRQPDTLMGGFYWNVYKTPEYFRNKIEYETEFEFIINVPSALFNVNTDTGKIIAMKAWIDIYRVAGTRYQIVNY